MSKRNDKPSLTAMAISRFPPDGWKAIESGGEAMIFQLPDDSLAKVYRHWADPFFQMGGYALIEEAIKNKFWEIQWKLPVMPELPDNVARPVKLLTTEKGTIIGFTMKKIVNIKTVDQLWREADNDEKINVLSRIYDLISELHGMGVVIGDLKPRDLAWNFKEKKIYLFDSDSIGFDRFPCRTFSLGYVDHKLLKFDKRHKTEIIPILCKPYEAVSDWLSFWAIVLQIYTGIDPYEGTHKTLKSKAERVMENVTIFSKEVKYPETAKPLSNVPRQILEKIFLAYRTGNRDIPEKSLLTI